MTRYVHVAYSVLLVGGKGGSEVVVQTDNDLQAVHLDQLLRQSCHWQDDEPVFQTHSNLKMGTVALFFSL